MPSSSMSDPLSLPEKGKKRTVVLRQSKENQVSKESKNGVHCPEEDCSVCGPTVQLDLSLSANLPPDQRP